MKLLFGWLVLIVLILYAFYYVNMNLEKSVEVKDLIKISENSNETIYSVKNSDNSDEIIELKIVKNSEIIVINADKLKKEKDSKNNNIELTINRDNKNIILVLNSKEKTSWIINSSENTKIDLIIYNKQNCEILSKSKLYKLDKNFEYFTKVEDIKFVKILNYLNKMFLINKINNFIYEKEISPKIIIDNYSNNEKYSLEYLKAKKIEKEFDFELVSSSKDLIKFNLNGPMFVEDRNNEVLNDITFSPDKSKMYQIIENGLKLIDVETKQETIKPIPVIKSIINPSGIAYDSLSENIFIANKQGKFFVFDAVEEQWISIRKYIEDFDINSLAYDEETNMYISSTWKREGLIFFDQNGNFAKRVNLENKLKGIEYHMNDKNEIPKLLVIPNGENLALVLIDKFVEKIWYYNKKEDKAILTYNYYAN